MVAACGAAGVTVIPAGGPAGLIHVNWHPHTLGEDYLPENPRGLPVTAYFHDTPQHSSSLLWDACATRFTSEVYEGAVEVPYPATAGVELPPPRPRDPSRPLIIGWSGIRGDGLGVVAKLAQHRGWEVNFRPPDWLSDSEEIKRLAGSDLNVLWYFASGRGKSLALMTAAAARRPLLVNSSEMFSQARGYADEVYIAAPSLSLEEAVDWALADGLTRVPNRFPQALSWPQLLASKILPEWRRLISR